MKSNFSKQDFYNLLTPNGDCLEWSGATYIKGYGVTRIDGVNVSTHRLSMTLEGHDVTNLNVLHSCDNPPCCNPKHLRLGTQQDNMNDLSDRGNTRGSLNSGAMLTESDVFTIRQRYSNGESQINIAISYNISPSAISNIAALCCITSI